MSKTLVGRRHSRQRETLTVSNDRKLVTKKESSSTNKRATETVRTRDLVTQNKRLDVQDYRLNMVENKQNKIVAHLLKYEATVQMRIDAVKDLLFTLSDDTKKQGQ